MMFVSVQYEHLHTIFCTTHFYIGLSVCVGVRQCECTIILRLFCLLTNPKTKVMVPILTQFVSVLWYFLIKSLTFTWDASRSSMKLSL